MPQAPKIDERTAEALFQALQSKLSKALQDRGDAGAQSCGPTTEALLRICARYAELIIQRLNRVPKKNHLAFLDLLGVSRRPPMPAQVPLSFTPVKKVPEGHRRIVVPALTKVAAAPGEGESEPAVFETTRELALTQLAIERIISLDPQCDLYSDHGALSEGGSSVVAFRGHQPVEHEFYIGHEAIFGVPGISRLTIRFAIDEDPSAASNRWALHWRIPSARGDSMLKPGLDTTANLTRSGELVFTGLAAWPRHTVLEAEAPWLVCRLLSDAGEPAAMEGRQRAQPCPLPRIRSLAIAAEWETEEAMISAAFCNGVPIDLSRDFFPFGEHPRFGAVCYLDCGAFVRRGACVSLNIRLTNPASAGDRSPIPAASKAATPVIQWEYWDNRRWRPLDCQDETDALTEHGRISFTVPASAQATAINGVQGSWIRVRLVAGNYGELGSDAATLGPPAVQSVTVDSVMNSGFQPPERLVVRNGPELEVIARGQPFQPYRPAAEPGPTFYLGFTAAQQAHRLLAERVLDLYFVMDHQADDLCLRSGVSTPTPALVWAYWNGHGWQETSVDDQTESLVSSGSASVRIGGDIAPRQNCAWGQGLFWIRVSWTSGEFHHLPKLRRVLLNTVTARHAITLENELLGSSTGKPNQVFAAARTPMLHELQLQVHEPGLPSEEGLRRLYREEGDNALTTVRDAQGNIEQVWVRWHEVGDFLTSNHHDRHFVVDRQSGQIRFGDGHRGLIPPRGSNNIRLRRYQAGGGVRGNQPPGSITQLRSSLPYVDKVSNPEPSSGGQDIEDWATLQARGSRALRHRDRAITVEDYEDLAICASPRVAKAKCYPGRDLSRDPIMADPLDAGVLSLVIVPRSAERRPVPDMGLLIRTRDYLDQRRAPDTELLLLAPNYLAVSVAVRVGPDSLSQSAGLLSRCEQSLERFLHPLYGAPDGEGWAFGQIPHESDFYALLESLPGLAYVGSVFVTTQAQRPELIESGNFLICSGEHRLELASRG